MKYYLFDIIKMQTPIVQSLAKLHVTKRSVAATVSGTKFTIASTGSFINTGTIANKTVDKGSTMNTFLQLGTITNNDVINNQQILRHIYQIKFKGIIFNNFLIDKGKVAGKKSVYLINSKATPNLVIVKNPIRSIFSSLGIYYHTNNQYLDTIEKKFHQVAVLSLVLAKLLLQHQPILYTIKIVNSGSSLLSEY